MMRKGNVILFILFFRFHAVQSQDFKWKSALDTVSKSGFYSIPLGIVWLAELKSDFSDIRILTDSNEVVPFILKEHANNQPKLSNDTLTKESSGDYLQQNWTFQIIEGSVRSTHIWVENNFPLPVDRITIKLSGPRFYERKVTVYQPVDGKIKDHVAATEFKSNQNNIIWLKGDKAERFLIVIENGDNPPLKIDSIIIESGKRHLVAYLEAGKSYSLVGGSEKAEPPKYDLVQFRDSIPDTLEVLSHGRLVANVGTKGNQKNKQRTWLWPAIIGMIAILGLLTVRLMREMRKKNI